MWNAEVQSRGVTPVHCSSGKKRNRLWWGQFLLVPKKQALSHTDFLPHWTAQNNPRPTSEAKKKEREGKRAVGEVSLDLKTLSLCRLCICSWKHIDCLCKSPVFTWLSLSKVKALYLHTQTPAKHAYHHALYAILVTTSKLLLSLLPARSSSLQWISMHSAFLLSPNVCSWLQCKESRRWLWILNLAITLWIVLLGKPFCGRLRKQKENEESKWGGQRGSTDWESRTQELPACAEGWAFIWPLSHQVVSLFTLSPRSSLRPSHYWLPWATPFSTTFIDLKRACHFPDSSFPTRTTV